MKQEEKQILFNSDESAQLKTGLSGWVSRNGRFYGTDERAARYDGCTHRLCEDCSKPVEKSRLVCAGCGEIRDKKRYESLPSVVWNEVGGLYSDAVDRYFWSWDDVDCYCEDENVKEDDLRLVICVPQYLHQLDESDYGQDELPEDGELPDKVKEAISRFNEVIKVTKPVSWFPGKTAAVRKAER
jgi:hypothetical protein